MNSNDNSMYLTADQCKKLMNQIDLDKLFDNLLVEYQKRNKTKQLKVELIRKEK